MDAPGISAATRMQDAVALFEESIEYLRLSYDRRRFYLERDLVWTVQEHLCQLIAVRSLPYQVFHHYPLGQGYQGRAANCDLALVKSDKTVAVAAEFKYEPAHTRTDILPTKFPVVFWAHDGVGDDVTRAYEFVAKGYAESAYSVFLDEGGFFRHRPPHPGSSWIDWPAPTTGVTSPSLLWTCVHGARAR